MTDSSRARWLVLASAVLFSTGGAAIKVQAFTGLQVSAGRSAVAAVVLWVFSGRRLRPTPRTLGVACAYACTVTLFVTATKLTTAANAIFLQSTAPLYLLVIGPMVLRERLGRFDPLYAALVMAGLGACMAGQGAATVTAPDPALGNALALGSSITWALTLAGLRQLSTGGADTAIDAVILGNALASAAVLPLAWPYPPAAPGAWATLAYLGVVQIGVAYVCLTRAVAHVRAVDASLLLLVEPVLNPVWTWLLRGERPGAWTVAGGAAILMASGLKQWTDARSGARAAVQGPPRY